MPPLISFLIARLTLQPSACLLLRHLHEQFDHHGIEAADFVIMNDELTRIPEAIDRSRRLHAVLWQNVAIAMSIKAVFLLLAVLDQASM